MGIFTPKMEKRRGALFKNGKNSGGGTPSGRGFMGKILRNRKPQGGYPFGRGFTGKFLGTGKTQVGTHTKWENSGRGYPFGRGFTGKIWNKENFILYL